MEREKLEVLLDLCFSYNEDGHKELLNKLQERDKESRNFIDKIQNLLEFGGVQYLSSETKKIILDDFHRHLNRIKNNIFDIDRYIRENKRGFTNSLVLGSLEDLKEAQYLILDLSEKYKKGLMVYIK